jgi:hypothetical protein
MAFWRSVGYDVDPAPNRDLSFSFADDNRILLMKTAHGYCTAIKTLGDIQKSPLR